MKVAVFLSLFCIAFSSFAQKKIDEQISKLDNSQFIIDHDKKSSFSVKSSSMRKLIRARGKAAPQLIAALGDENRNIMAHLVLCHIYFGHASFAGPKMVTENDEHVNKYFLGKEKGEGAVISEVKKNGSYKIYFTESEVARLKEFWRNYTK